MFLCALSYVRSKKREKNSTDNIRIATVPTDRSRMPVNLAQFKTVTVLKIKEKIRNIVTE